jgi:bifunctional DNase/RNase
MGRLGKAKWCLLGCLIVVFLFLACSFFIPGWLADTVQWIGHDELTSGRSTSPEGESTGNGALVEMVVDRVGFIEMYEQPVVVLKERGGDRYLPVFIGFLEADAITVIIEGIDMPRPLTSDLLVSVIQSMEAKVTHIVITDIKDDIFYARIVIDAHQTPMEIDARPSDAIAVALRTEVPVYVNKTVLDKAAIQIEQQTW